MAGDWMPHNIQGRIDMGRVWLEKLKVKGAAWHPNRAYPKK